MRDDISIRLLRDGYAALGRLRAAAGGADWFAARMLGRSALVVRGEAGVRAFYDPGLVTRRGAMPAPVRLLLFGRGAVHGLAGETHRRRKQVYLDIVDRDAVERLTAEVSDRLARAILGWPDRASVRLFDELVEVYGAAVLAWAGIAVEEAEARAVSRRLAAIVDGFGPGGTTYARAWAARLRANRWARDRVRRVRRGADAAPAGSPLARMAASDLTDGVAAVELLNLLRPTVAVAYFGAFAAQALTDHPDRKARLAAGDAAELRAFEHELRRWYPFVPALPGRLVRDVQWQGQRLPRGSFLVLDVLGTDRDPRLWPDPDRFDPARFLGREPTAYAFVPQGGGDPAHGHRCPGEPLAVGILAETVHQLARLDIELSGPGHDVPVRRMPSLPADGIELRSVRPAGAEAVVAHG